MRTIFRRAVSSLNCGLSASKILISGLFVAALLVVMPQTARAQGTTYSVCKLPATCDFESPEAAVNDPGIVDGDTIDIVTDTYVLVSTLQVNNSITILANNSVFDADGRRAIDVTGVATNLSLTNVTILNGLADASGGGALRVSDGAVVTIINGTFENNQADFGGAIHNNGSTVQINVAVFTGNRATAGEGGAVLTDSGGSTTLQWTEIDGNQASLAGGGLAVMHNNSQLNLIASTVSNNALTGIGIGGASNDFDTGTSFGCPVGVSGISAQSFVPTLNSLSAYDFEIRFGGSPPGAGTVFIGRVKDIQNGLPGVEIGTSTAIIPAGAASSIWLRYTMDIPVVLKPGNLYLLEAGVPESAGFTILGSFGNPYGAGEASNCGSALLSDVDFDFRTFGALDGSGGILASQAGFAGLFNTTVSGNVGDGATAGPNSNSIVTTLFSTITNNSGNGLTAQSGETDGLVFITASIVADNGVNDCFGGTTSSGYNLIGNPTNCVVSPFTGDLIGSALVPIDPLLGPLQDNGGRTATHAIDSSSPAFNRAAAGGTLPCSDAATDQRDVTRPNGAACDIGAFEFVSPIGPLQTLIDAADTGAVINIPAGTYTETITIGDGKTLKGAGPGTTVIDATGLNVSAITATGSFTLEDIRVTGGNTTGDGGGIYADFAGHTIILSNVQFDNNHASRWGGAIYIFDGTLNATDVTFTDNSSDQEGGAIFANMSNVAVANGMFDGNSGGDGGALGLVNGSGSIETSVFTANEAFGEDGPGRGGAIFNGGNLTITDTSINTSIADIGGGIFNSGFGGSLELVRSTLSNNTADNPGGIAGGAIAGAGTMTIINTTISGNTAVAGNGGGIGLSGGTARLNNVTLAFNAAPLGDRGALFAGTGGLISVSNSLLSDNSDSGIFDIVCGTINSLGYNVSMADGCLETATDMTADPLINVLAINGGPTKTHSLLAGSPAIDAADPGQLAIELASALSSSQLNFNGGAVESGGNLVPVSGEFVAGSIFASAPDEGPFDLNGSFSTQFSFQITDPVAWSGAPTEPSGDGFTFAIAANSTVLGEPGGRLGVATTPGPLGTVSVEFDTFPNGGDISTNAIGINVGGFGDGQSVISIAQAAISGAFDDGNVWTAWIDYHADINLLEVRVAADGVRPDLPQLAHTVDIAVEVGATGYYGFTGGTGLAYATHTVTAWEFFITSCPAFDQRGVSRPKGAGCDIGAYEAQSALQLGDVTLRTATVGEGLPDGMSYPGVTDVNIIEIPVEKLAGDSFNAPESAPLGSFPLGSFPIGSFDMRSSPLGSFPLGSFPIGSFPIGSFPLGSFPIGSFPLSSMPLLTEGGWAEILAGIPELAGAPLQTVTFEQLLTHSSFPGSVAGLELRDLSIQGSPLGSFSLPGLSLGATTVEVLDDWATNAGETSEICTTLAPDFIDCADDDTLLSLEYKGAPVSALSLSSLPLGSFPIGSFPLGSFPIGSFPLGSFPIGSFPLGSFPIGSFPLGSFPIGSFPLGSFNLLAAPTATLPLGSFPIGSFPLGSFEIEGESFCDFYDDQVTSADGRTCAFLGVDPGTDTLADLIAKLADSAGNIDISTTPLGSFPMGSFKIGSLPIGSFPIGSFDLVNPPLSELTLADFDGCEKIDSVSGCSSSPLSPTSTLTDVVVEYGSLAASPLGSFPLGSFNLANIPLGSFPIGSFPLGSFEINGTPLGSFPLGSFDLISSPLGSFPLGSFTSAALEAVVDDPTGLCGSCQTLTDAELAGAIKATATLYDLAGSSLFATTTFGEVLDAMSLAMLYGPGTLASIEDTGALTLGQILISMMLKTDFPWETIPLAQLDAQEFSADNFVTYSVAIQLQGTETETFTVEVTLDDSFLYLEDSSALFVIIDGPDDLSFIDDPVIVDNGNGTQTLSYSLNLGGFNTSVIGFSAVPSIALGTYAATATVQFGTNDPVVADNSVASVEIIPDPLTDPSGPSVPLAAPDVLYLGFIDTPDDNDFFAVQGEAGSRVAVFMANPAGDNDLIMYEPATTVEAKGQSTVSAALDSIPFEDDGVNYQGNLEEEPNALEDVNLAAAPLASISTNRGGSDEMVSAIAGDNEPFLIQVSGYNGATSVQPYTLRVKVTPEVTNPQCTGRVWPGGATSTVEPAGSWTPNTNAVFLVNGARLAASDPDGAAGADAALTAINSLIHAPGITDGVVIDVSTDMELLNILDENGLNVNAFYDKWDFNPCDVDAANSIVNVITRYLETKRAGSPDLAYVTIVGSDEIIPFARKPDETSIANESTFANEFADNAMFGALVTRHFLSDDSYGDIDPIPWLDRFLNVPELGVGRLVESAVDIQSAAENYIAFGGVLDPQTALSAGYDFIADAAEEIDDTFTRYSPAFGFGVEPALIDQPGVAPNSAWTRSDFLSATGLNTTHPVEQVSFNMHFDFDEALPSSGDAAGTYTENLINTTDLGTTNLAGGIWFTVGCHSGSNLADVSVVGGAPTDDWAQAFSRLGAVYLAQNAYGLGDTEAVALTERLMASFALNLNGSLTIGQAHAYAKQQYFADLGLYGEYDYKALQAATLFGLPMYQYGNGAMVEDPVPPPLPVSTDPVSGLASASWSMPDTGITETMTDSKGMLFSVDGEVQFVHYRPLQPIVRRDVTGPNGEIAGGAFLTALTTEDQDVDDIAFARPVIALGRIEPEIETDTVVFPTAFTNIGNFNAPASGGGPFEPRQQLNVIVGQFTSPMDGDTGGVERLFRSFATQIFYRSETSPAIADDFIRPEFDNVQASVVGLTPSRQAVFSVDVFDEGTVERVAVLYLKSVSGGVGTWELVDLVKGGGSSNWTGGGPVEVAGEIDYMVQAVDGNGNVANSTFKGLFYPADTLDPAPDPELDPGPDTDNIGVIATVAGSEVNKNDWIDGDQVDVEITHNPSIAYEYSVDFAPFIPLAEDGKFIITEDGVHIVTVRETTGDNPVTFVILIDTTPPSVIISTPTDGDFIVQGEDTEADYDCLDAGSGIASCMGTVADGVSVPSTSIGSQVFAVTAQDYAHEGDFPSSAVTVQNSYYVVQALDLDSSIDPIAIDNSFGITVSLTDLCDFAETVIIEWGDGTEEVIELIDACPGGVNGSHNLDRSHPYSSADVYQINVSVDYGEQFTQLGVIDFVVIYDASGGFVTGGGWIDSPPSAYTPNNPNDELVTGKAHFGFVSKYKKGQSVPDGSTNFRFTAGVLEFDSTSYDWLIISGPRARFKGTGTVNGGSEPYKFMLTAIDAGASTPEEVFSQDGFRIKIWQDVAGVEDVLYDNGLSVDEGSGDGGTTQLSGGSVTVHSGKGKK